MFHFVIILWHLCVQGIVQLDYSKQILYISVTQKAGLLSRKRLIFRDSNLMKEPKVNSASVLVLAKMRRT